MRPNKVYGFAVAVVTLIVGAFTAPMTAQSDPIEKEILLIIDQRNAWPDCKLPQLIAAQLVEHNFLKVADPRIADKLPPHQAGVLPKNEILELGRQTDCRFVLWCSIDKEGLDKEDNFSLPFVAKQRRVTARLQGRYYILDCERGRIVRKGTLELKRHGPSSLQLVDFGDADAQLLVPYSDQERLFAELELEAAEQIEEDVLYVAKLR